MKALCSVANDVVYGLSSLIRCNRASRFISAVNLAFSSSVYEDDDDDDSRLGDLSSLNNGFQDSSFRLSAELGRSRNRDTNNCFPVSKYRVVDNEMSTIKYILIKHGWNFGLASGFGVELNEGNVIKALNAIFDESGSAALSLRFLGWLQHGVGLNCTVRTVCTMIFILVYGNMNYRVVDFLDDLIKDLSEEGGQEHSLLNVFEGIHTGGKVRETVYSMLVKCYLERNMINVAVTLVCHMDRSGLFPSRGVCNLLIRSLLWSDQEDLVWDFLELIWWRGMLDASLISPLISYYCSKDGPYTGWKLLMDVRNYGIKPDFVAYTILIQSFCKASHLKEATSLVFKMTQLGLWPDSVLLGSLMDGYCKMDRLQDALCIAHYFRVPLTIYMYNSFISLFCKVGEMGLACNIFIEMSELGYHPDCFIYSTIISGYCKRGDTKKGLEWLGRMLKCGVKPSVTTFTVLIQHYSQRGAMNVAEHMFCSMMDQGLVADIVVFNTLMNGYGKSGELHKAFQMLGVMRSAGVSPDTVTYNIILHSLITRGFVYEAKDIFNELLRRGFSPDVITFSDLINGFSERENFQEAFLVWTTMSKYNTTPDVITCSALLSGYCIACRMDEAIVLFNRLLNAGLIPDLILYNTLIRGFCRIGDTTHACHLIQMMVEQDLMPDNQTYRSLVHGYKKKLVDNAAEFALLKLQRILAAYGLVYRG